MDINAIKESLRKPYLSVFLDGRNEHGSHVLTMPGDSVSDHGEIISLLESQEDGIAEQIISEAEKAGFEINHCVVTIWRQQHDHICYWEYVGLDLLLTELMIGTADEQRAEFLAMEAAP